MKQKTFASAAWKRKGKVTRRERFLAEIDAVIPWEPILALIEPHLALWHFSVSEHSQTN